MAIKMIGKSINRLVFNKHLLFTNTVTSGILLYLGEYFAQKIEHVKNHEKLKQMAVVGISQGPFHHYTYIWMERIFPGSSRVAIFKKIMADQFAVSPLFIAHYFYTAYFLEGKKLNEINSIFKQKFFQVYITDWMVWPAAQFINFHFVPLQYRVLYINFITMFYNIFLCYVKNKD